MITWTGVKSQSITGLLFLALVFGGEPAFATTEDNEGSADDTVTTARVTVSVLGKDSGIVISGATVRIGDTDDSVLKTNANGEAEFSNISYGNITLEVEAPGWSLVKKEFLIDSDRTILVELVPLTTDLTVQVVGLDDGSEAPIPACTVMVTFNGAPPIEKRTDKNGEVIIRGLPRGDISIHILATGWETGSRKVTLDEEEFATKITLQQQIPPSKPDLPVELP